jgi:uncharacterized protein with ATP-grasp and redox domains
MKLHPRCLICQINRLVEEIQLSTKDLGVQNRATSEILRFYDNLNSVNSTTTSKKAREIIAQITGVEDPYHSMKIRINTYAKIESQQFQSYIDNIKDPYQKFKSACLTAIIGNLMEFFMLEHSFKESKLLDLLLFEDLEIDDTWEVFHLLNSATTIVYLTDNAGEVFFDAILIKTIKNLFPNIKIITAVKDKPIVNDATMTDALSANLNILSDVLITTGQNCIGLDYQTASEEFKQYWIKSDLIIAKGMGHFETFDGNMEYFKSPLFYLFRTKCSSVAEAIGVSRNKNIAKLVRIN